MKVGVVGYGSIGTRHASNAATLGHDVLVYDPAMRRDVKFERNIYEKCDAVVIATPTMFHQQGIRACAERGKHMLIEKPIALASDYMRELLDLAETNKAVAMMGNNLRFHPCVQQAKDWIKEGCIGDPIWASFTCSQLGQKYINDGVTLNTGAHEVDIALHLFGPATVLCASARRPQLKQNGGDDIVDFVLEHRNGVRSSFHLDIVTPNEIREAWIIGDKQRIGLELRNRNSALGTNAKGHGGTYEDDYFEEMRAFFDRIEGKNVLGATGWDGLGTLELLLDVRKKAGLDG